VKPDVHPKIATVFEKKDPKLIISLIRKRQGSDAGLDSTERFGCFVVVVEATRARGFLIGDPRELQGKASRLAEELQDMAYYRDRSQGLALLSSSIEAMGHLHVSDQLVSLSCEQSSVFAYCAAAAVASVWHSSGSMQAVQRHLSQQLDISVVDYCFRNVLVPAAEAILSNDCNAYSKLQWPRELGLQQKRGAHCATGEMSTMRIKTAGTTGNGTSVRSDSCISKGTLRGGNLGTSAGISAGFSSSPITRVVPVVKTNHNRSLRSASFGSEAGSAASKISLTGPLPQFKSSLTDFPSRTSTGTGTGTAARLVGLHRARRVRLPCLSYMD
jgi:hypothetical protein